MIKRVNLTNRSMTMAPVDPALLHEYLGGVGLSARLMAPISSSGLSPLDSEVPLIVSGGVMNGTGFPGMNRACFYSLSPLTGLFAPSWLGGNFGTGLARALSKPCTCHHEGPLPAPEGGDRLIREGSWPRRQDASLRMTRHLRALVEPLSMANRDFVKAPGDRKCTC